MKSGLMKGRRAEQIVETIRQGVETSRDLALAFGTKVGNISPELSRLETMGLIERAGMAQSTGGPPCVRWRAVERTPA